VIGLRILEVEDPQSRLERSFLVSIRDEYAVTHQLALLTIGVQQRLRDRRLRYLPDRGLVRLLR